MTTKETEENIKRISASIDLQRLERDIDWLVSSSNLTAMIDLLKFMSRNFIDSSQTHECFLLNGERLTILEVLKMYWSEFYRLETELEDEELQKAYTQLQSIKKQKLGKS